MRRLLLRVIHENRVLLLLLVSVMLFPTVFASMGPENPMRTLPISKPLLATSSNATLYGNVISAASWTTTNRPFGIYNIGADGEYSEVFTHTGLNGQAGVYIDGKYYVSNAFEMYGMLMSLGISVYDVESGSFEQSIPLSTQWINYAFNYAYDRINEIVYAITYNSYKSGYVLNTFDPVSGSYTPLCNLASYYFCLAIDGESNLYGINSLGDVYVIDTETGSAGEAIASTGFTPAYSQSATWSPRDKKILWAAYNNTESKLIAIDPKTGSVEDVCEFPKLEIIGFYTTDSMADDNAPAAPQDLEVSYTSPGSNQAVVSCKVPSETVNGNTLTGDLTISVIVDKELAASAPVQPGQDYSNTIEIADGKHKIVVYFTNEVGDGIPAQLWTFAGFDVPVAVGDLAYTLSPDGLLSLTWSAPARGENDGTLAPLSYIVYRNDEEVAQGLAVTQFEETLPNTLSLYTYQVVPMAGEKRGPATATERFAFGDHLALPYTQTFADADEYAFFTAIDANEDNNTWRHDSYVKTAKYQSQYGGGAADDYFATPKLILEAGKVYSFQFETFADAVSNPEKLAVVVADELTEQAMREADVIMETTDINTTRKFIELLYVPETTGAYYLAFHCTTPANAWTVNVTNIVIEDFGNSQAPKIIEDLSVLLEGNGSLTAHLSFTAPSTDFNDNAITALSSIEILRDNVVIKTFDNPSPGDELEYTDEVPSLDYYTYTVLSYNDYGHGVPFHKRVYVSPSFMPYFLPLKTQSDFDKLTILDTNNDTDTWEYSSEHQALGFIHKNKTIYSNDWALTPLIEMGVETMIEIQFDAKTLTGDKVLCVVFANDERTQTINYTVVREEEMETFSAYFQVPSAGYYSVGFYAEFTPNSDVELYINNIKVIAGPSKLAPGPVSSLTMKAADEGELKATLNFWMPYNTLGGESLSGKMIGVDIYNRENTWIGTIANLTSGSAVEIEVPALQGINNFTVITKNEAGSGGRASIAGFCGIDIPFRVDNLAGQASSDNMSLRLFWTAPDRGMYDQWFDASQVVYHIYRKNPADGALALLGDTKELFYVVEVDDEVLAEYHYVVTASTAAGESLPVDISRVLGKPYELPFAETLARGETATSPWKMRPQFPTFIWEIIGQEPSLGMQTDDGGCFILYDEYERMGQSQLTMPKVMLNGNDDPYLSFSMFHYANAASYVRILISTDELQYTILGDVFTGDLADMKNGWAEHTISLTNYKDEPWVSIAFEGTLGNGPQSLLLDNISVENRSGNDARLVSFKGPQSARADETISLVAEVMNNGKNALNYGVELYLDDVAIDSRSQGTVSSGDLRSFIFNYTPQEGDINSELVFSVKVIVKDVEDENPRNNEASASVLVKNPTLPPATHLAGAVSETGKDVELSWEHHIPGIREQVADSFESYGSFIIDKIGDYTLIDSDGQFTAGINSQTGPMYFENVYEPMAFMVFNPTACAIDLKEGPWLAPHSGYQYLISWVSVDANGIAENDDWLISPRIAGGAQLSFWANQLSNASTGESFEIHYSSTTNALNAFTLLEGVTLRETEWTEYTFNLPADAHYFAIRHTESEFALMIDDLSYTADDGTNDLKLQGYNIYRNNIKHNSQPVEEVQFLDDEISESGTYTYYVTTLYDEGESIPSNKVAIEVAITAINDILADGALVYGRSHAIVVKNAEGKAIRIYSLEGKAMRQAEANSSEEVYPVNPGVYIVTVDGIAAGKILVKQ